jgi:heptaprenyl diphosphate synthase
MNIKTFLNNTEAMLFAYTNHKNEKIRDSLQYLIKTGGKRIRPQLVYYGSQFGTKPSEWVDDITEMNTEMGTEMGTDKYIAKYTETNVSDETYNELVKTAVAIELCHLGSLYHDDIMDNSFMRRGVETAHIKYGEDIAIIVGDLLFAKSGAIGNELNENAREELLIAFEKMCDGQAVESVGFTANGHFTLRDFYFEVASKKTAALIKAALKMGAYCANTPPKTVKLLDVFGENIGIAYQIIDDILDIKNDETGKRFGTDLLEGVQSIITVLLKEKVEKQIASKEEIQVIKSIGYAKSVAIKKSQLEQMRFIISRSSVIKEAEIIAKNMTKTATDALIEIGSPQKTKELANFGNSLISRLS